VNRPRILGDLVLRMLPDGRQSEVVKPLIYVDKKGRRFQCIPGDVIDGASIPRMFWRLIGAPYTGRHRRAAALHDCEYMRRRYPRKVCDRMFREVMKLDHVGRIKRNTMYRMVRLFGGHAYRT